MLDMRLLLREWMKRRDIRPTAYALSKASKGAIPVSTATRLLDQESPPKRIDFTTLDTLCDVLNIGPGELLKR